MREYARIEEPPPIQRMDRSHPTRRGVGPLTGWRPRRSTAPGLDLRRMIPSMPSLPSMPPLPPVSAKLVAIVLVAVTVIGLQAWTLNRLSRVSADLAVASTNLDEARASLGLLWDTTDKLDEDRIACLGQLADSIRSVFAYAQGEVRLWETAYAAQAQRLDENAGRIARGDEAIARLNAATRGVTTRLDELGQGLGLRIDQLARADEVQLGRLTTLESQGRTQGASIEALARRAEAQEANVRSASSTIVSLRETLASLDAELTRLEENVETTGSAYGRINTRMQSLDGWVEEFRRAGLDGDAVVSRLAALTDEVRRVRVRVDSLRSARPVVRPGQAGN